MGSAEGFRWVDSAAELRRLARVLDRRSEFSLDSESNSGFAYEERLCLLQINDGQSIWLLDLLALPGGEGALDPLRPALENAGQRIWLHGAEFDVGSLKRDYGVSLRGVWDSQQAASYLGWEKTGYGAVVERICHVALPKQFARHDWSQRPIVGEALQYALNDVLYLPQIGRALQTAVGAADLEEEVSIACRAVEQATWNGGFQADGMWSIKGARRLPAEARKILVALFFWRDRIARELDQPPGRTINNRALLALSRDPPRSRGELRRMRLPRRITDRWSSDLLEVIAEARRKPPSAPPPAPRPPDPAARRRGVRLKEWRRTEAERRGVTLQAVLPLTALKYIQQHGAADLSRVPQLGPKRIRMYGERLRGLAEVEAE